MSRRFSGAAAAALALLAASCAPEGEPARLGWTAEQRRVLRSLCIDALGEPPADPSNAVAADPRAAALGRALFFERGFSRDGSIACAHCHQPERFFTDGLPRSVALGETSRNAPSLVGSAWQNWFFWDGRADSAWAQALQPWEHAAEQGATRTLIARLIAERHRAPYEELFGALPELRDRRRFPASAGPLGDEEERAAWAAMAPADREAVDRVFTNAAKAVAAYERLLVPGAAPFDEYVRAVESGDEDAAKAALDEEAVAGLRLFVGTAGCLRCHDGPLFTNREFHAVGVSAPLGEAFDRGRADGVGLVRDSPFNCLGPFSDAAEEDCGELRFLKTAGDELLGALKVPSLRNVGQTAPYMHAGQKATLRDVLLHYVTAPAPLVGHTDLSPLPLGEEQLRQLEAFLRSLSAPLATPAEWLEPPPEG